jgi:hypothetical protein
MARPLGCNLTFGGIKTLSLTTGVQRDGTYDFLIHGLGGAAVDRHLHGYAQVSSEGIIVRGGARVKNKPGEYLGLGVQLTQTPQEIARVAITPTTAGLKCQFKQLVAAQWLEGDPTTMGGRIKRTEIALPSSKGAVAAEYSISMFDARSGVPSNSSEQVVVPFSSPLPFGVVFRKV